MFIFILKKDEDLQNITEKTFKSKYNKCKKGMKIKFVHKYFDISYNQIHDNNHKDIRKEGIHIFEPECIIDLQNNHENVVKKEQLGIHITGKYKEIKNVIIDEAYYGEKWSFYKLCCCKTILCRKKPKDD